MEYQDINKLVNYSEATADDWENLPTPIALNMIVLATDTGEFKIGDGNKKYSQLAAKFTLGSATQMQALASKMPTIPGGSTGKIFLVNEAGDGYDLSDLALTSYVTDEDWQAIVGNYATATHDHDSTYALKTDIDDVINAAYPEPLLGQDVMSYVVLDKLRRDSDTAITLTNSLADEFNDYSGLNPNKTLNGVIVDGAMTTADFYTAKTARSEAITNAASTIVDGVIYSAGGSDGSPVDNFDTYSCLTDTWDTITPFFGVRQDAAVASIGPYVYTFGGYNGSAYLNDFYLYDTTSGQHLQLTSGATIRSGASLINIGGKLYLYGGYDGDYLNDHWVYDPAQDEWTQLGDGPSARAYHTGVSNGTYGYIMGGKGSSVNKDSWIYNPTGDSWNDTLDLPTELYKHNASLIDNNIYVVGGTDDVDINVSVYKYSIGEVAWETVDEFTDATISGILEAYAGALFAVNGVGDAGSVYKINSSPQLNITSITNEYTEDVTISRVFARGTLPDVNTNTIIEVSRDDGETFAVVSVEESKLTENADIKAYVGNTEFTHKFEKQMLDLSTAIVQDHRGDLTQFIVDTDNLYGHTGIAIDDSFVGAKLSTVSGDVVITAVTGDGTASATVEISGTLAAGTYTVLSVTKIKYDEATDSLKPVSETVTTNSVARVPIVMSVENTNIKQVLVESAILTDNVCSLLGVGTSYYTYRSFTWTEVVKYDIDTWYYLNASNAWIASTNTLVDDVITEALAVSENQTPVSLLTTLDIGTLALTELVIAWINDEYVYDVTSSYLLEHVPTTFASGKDVCYRIRNLIKDETTNLKGVRLNWY